MGCVLRILAGRKTDVTGYGWTASRMPAERPPWCARVCGVVGQALSRANRFFHGFYWSGFPTHRQRISRGLAEAHGEHLLARHFQLELAGEGALGWGDGHRPGIDDLRAESAAGGQIEVGQRGLVVIQEVQIVNARARDAGIVGASYGNRALRGAGLDDAAQERDARRALAMQHAALGPPQNIVRVEIGLAVSHVGAVRHAEPEAAHHFPGGNIAPAFGNIAFILALVEGQGFAEGSAPLGNFGEVVTWYAGVREPWRGGVVH